MHPRYFHGMASAMALCLLDFSVQAQYLEWNGLINEGLASNSTISRVAVNSGGSAWIAGTFSGSFDLDPNAIGTYTLVSQVGSLSNAFLANYGSNGSFISGGQIMARRDISLKGMILENSGNIVLSGSFNDTIDLNMVNGKALYAPLNSGSEEGFIVKYNTQGLFQWARQLNSSVHTRPSDMASDPSGNIILAGTFKGITDFDGGSPVFNLSAVDEDLFIAKYNSNGNFINAIRLGESGSPSGVQFLGDVDVDASGNIYISGRFEGSVDFDPGTGLTVLISNGQNDFFIAKYSPSLQLIWAYQLGSGGQEGSVCHHIYDNSLWLTGAFSDTINVNLKTGSTNLISKGQSDIYIARYDLSANLQSSASIGGSGMDEAVALEVYNADSLLITGHFQGSVDFDPGPAVKNLTATTSKSVFFASYNASSGLNWSSEVAGSDDVHASRISIDGYGKPYLFGHLKGSADFDAHSATPRTYSGPSSFIAKYGKCGEAVFNISTTNASCGKSDGSAMANIIGGSLPLRYFWTSGDLSNTADSLRSGYYYLTVIDTLNCAYYSDPILINENGGPVITPTTIVPVSCPGGNNGAISITVSGGNTPYTYTWSGGQKSQNISGLTVGPYEVTVTDNSGCKSHHGVTLSEPEEIEIYAVITKPACGLNNGSIAAAVSGGTSPYLYTWLPSGSGSTISGIGAGIYFVTVTDARSCSQSMAIAVSNVNAADIILDSLVHISCGIGGGGIYVSVYGGDPPYNYLWTPTGSISQDLIAPSSGTYSLMVGDNSNCKAAFVSSLGMEKAPPPPICIVDVDSASGQATVVWEKPLTRGIIDYYNIYRETSALNVYDLIAGELDFSDLSLYKDGIADTWTRPWSYKLSYTDTCGIESDLSESHTTIHTVISKNAQQEFNLLWTPYRGNFPVLSYTCFRYSDSTSSVDSITTLPANIFTFTDVTSPSTGPDVYYYMQVRHPDGCTATDAQNRNSSRSNRGSLIPQDYSTHAGELNPPQNTCLKIYPNPVNDEFRMEFESRFGGRAFMTIHSANGMEVKSETLSVMNGKNVWFMKAVGLKSGAYIVRISSSGENFMTRLIVIR